MLFQVLYTFLFLIPAQADLNCLEGCEKNLQDLADVNAMFAISNSAEVNREILKESLSPTESMTVPVIALMTPEEVRKAILDVNFKAAPHAAFFFVNRTPAGSLRSEGRNECAVETTEANTMLHGAILQRKDDPTKTRKHIVDTVGKTTKIGCEIGDKENELEVSARIYETLGKPKVFQFVGDTGIEKFHNLIGQKDPYGREAIGMDRVVINTQDLHGNSFVGKDGQIFLAGLVVKRGFFKTLQENNRSRTTLNYGAQIQVPGQGPFADAGAGVYSNLAHHHRTSQNTFRERCCRHGPDSEKTCGWWLLDI